jgi:hypothetical protein
LLLTDWKYVKKKFGLEAFDSAFELFNRGLM